MTSQPPAPEQSPPQRTNPNPDLGAASKPTVEPIRKNLSQSTLGHSIPAGSLSTSPDPPAINTVSSKWVRTNVAITVLAVPIVNVQTTGAPGMGVQPSQLSNSQPGSEKAPRVTSDPSGKSESQALGQSILRPRGSPAPMPLTTAPPPDIPTASATGGKSTGTSADTVSLVPAWRPNEMPLVMSDKSRVMMSKLATSPMSIPIKSMCSWPLSVTRNRLKKYSKSSSSMVALSVEPEKSPAVTGPNETSAPGVV